MTQRQFSSESLWTWFLRIVMGLVVFLLGSLYSDVKSMMVDINDIKIMIAESKKDVEYLREDYHEFKTDTKGRISKLESVR